MTVLTAKKVLECMLWLTTLTLVCVSCGKQDVFVGTWRPQNPYHANDVVVIKKESDNKYLVNWVPGAKPQGLIAYVCSHGELHGVRSIAAQGSAPRRTVEDTFVPLGQSRLEYKAKDSRFGGVTAVFLRKDWSTETP